MTAYVVLSSNQLTGEGQAGYGRAMMSRELIHAIYGAVLTIWAGFFGLALVWPWALASAAVWPVACIVAGGIYDMRRPQPPDPDAEIRRWLSR